MNNIIDPRPMEPDWVRDTTPEPNGIIEWSILTWRWNKELKKTEFVTRYHEGKALEFMSYIGGRTMSPFPEPCCITVDASQAIIPKTVPPKWYNIQHREDDLMDWIIEYDNNKENGQDIYELMSWIAYLLEEGKNFTLDLDIHDPTP